MQSSIARATDRNVSRRSIDPSSEEGWAIAVIVGSVLDGPYLSVLSVILTGVLSVCRSRAHLSSRGQKANPLTCGRATTGDQLAIREVIRPCKPVARVTSTLIDGRGLTGPSFLRDRLRTRSGMLYRGVGCALRYRVSSEYGSLVACQAQVTRPRRALNEHDAHQRYPEHQAFWLRTLQAGCQHKLQERCAGRAPA